MNKLYTLILLLTVPIQANAIDVVKINKGKSRSQLQTQYKLDVIKKALESTEEKYGPYDIVTQGLATTIDRAILEVKSGKTINIFPAISTKKWEDNTVAIRVPIRRGILNYRLLAINKNNKEKFKNISSVDDLKKLKVGLRTGWATTKILKENGFNVVEANTYDGLFYMLASGRVDYIPRGLNEIYGELEQRNKRLSSLSVESTLALYIPAPFYIFVSPNEPRLAERLREGLNLIVKNGELKIIFDKFYFEKINKSSLNERKLINIGNPFLPEKTPLNRKELWFENDSNLFL